MPVVVGDSVVANWEGTSPRIRDIRGHQRFLLKRGKFRLKYSSSSDVGLRSIHAQEEIVDVRTLLSQARDAFWGDLASTTYRLGLPHLPLSKESNLSRRRPWFNFQSRKDQV